MNNSYEFTLNKRIQELDNERRDLKSKIKAWEISYNNLYRRVHGDTLYIGSAEYTMDKNLCMFLRKDIEISEKRLYQVEYEIISCYTELNEIRQNRAVQKTNFYQGVDDYDVFDELYKYGYINGHKI